MRGRYPDLQVTRDVIQIGKLGQSQLVDLDNVPNKLRIWITSLVLCVAGSAAAAPSVKPPAEWKGGPNDELMHAAGLESHFGEGHGIIEAEKYDAPKPGVVLYVTRVAANTSAIGSAAAAELEHVKPSNAPDAKVEQTVSDHAIVARVEWRDDKSGVRGITRMVIAATSAKISAVKGECLASTDAPAELVTACDHALATLDPDIELTARVEIPAASTSTSTGTSTSTNSYMSDGSKTPMPPIVIQQESPSTDKRPIVVGAGVVVLAVVFWWNRRRRERFAAEDKTDDG